MNRYMISYIDAAGGGYTTNGNCEMRLPRPIKTMEDVDAIRRMVRDQYGATNPIIMGFSLFDDEEGR